MAGIGSTKILSANSGLIPKRTLQTWQIILVFCVSSLIFCSSQKPISRSRCVTSGGAVNCLIRTAVPARTLLNGQAIGLAQRPAPKPLNKFSLTSREKLIWLARRGKPEVEGAEGAVLSFLRGA